MKFLTILVLFSSVSLHAQEWHTPIAEPDDCGGLIVSDSVLELARQVDEIVTPEVQSQVDGPNLLVSQAVQSSKALVCAQIEEFALQNKLDLVVNCERNPMIIPPVQVQVIKFPGITEARARLEEEIARLEQATDPASRFNLPRRRFDLQCLLNNDIEHPDCRLRVWDKLKGQSVVQIEVQDRSGQWYEFNQMKIDTFSGTPGPKIRQGDKQVPEGRFDLSSVSLNSNYFSAVHVDYENWSDRREMLGDLEQPGRSRGGLIKIHGNGGSVGCLDMGNKGTAYMSALVSMSLANRRTPKIDIYPTQMDKAAELGTWPGFQSYAGFWSRQQDKTWGHSQSVNRDVVRMDQLMRSVPSSDE